ncbi:hypothetical protein DNTS_024637 [Danionella cerebrum]|uniref:Uncharacterized protein n=1 Tax=Danionella cerebrum TaxID=2873325 RepID=A0A553NHN1_9TELE|nr:hypothetical protein DNTS_024637 [Danionella translucida]
MNRVESKGSQVISAELMLGLLLSFVYRVCSSLAFPSKLALVDVAVFCFFLLNSLVLLIMDHKELKISLKQPQLLLCNTSGIFLQMDYFANFSFGLLWLIYPGCLLGSKENLPLIRAFGAMMVGDSFASFQSQEPMRNDENSVFSSRVMGTLLVLVLMIHNQITSSAWKPSQLCIYLVGVSLWAGNSILGYLSSKEARAESVKEMYFLATQRNRSLHVQ